MNASPRGAFLILVAALLLVPVACQTTKEAPKAKENPKTERLVVEWHSFFRGPDHTLEHASCLGGALGRDYRENTDGVLFYDKDSVLRIHTFNSSRSHYHAHLFVEIDGQTVERDPVLAENGLISIDLAKVAGTPLALILSNAAGAFRDKKSETPDALVAPYSISFGFVPRDQAERVLALQPRHEWRHERLNLAATLVAGPVNRTDALVTFCEPTGNATVLLEQGVLYWSTGNAVLVPRIGVEVLGKDGPWMRAASYSLPELARKEALKGTKSLTFRLAGMDLFSFAPPPRAVVKVPQEATSTAEVAVRVEAPGRTDAKLRLALAAAWQEGSTSEPHVRVETHEISTSEMKLGVSIDEKDLSGPVSGWVAHRITEPWKLPKKSGGLMDVVPPLSVTTGFLPTASTADSFMNLVGPRHASHFDPVWWNPGGVSGKNLLAEFLKAFDESGSEAGGSDSSTGFDWDPNLTPPPWFGIVPNGDGSGTPGTGPGADSSSSGFDWSLFPWAPWGPLEDSHCGCWPGAKWCARDTNDVAGDENECKGQCGEKCPGNGHCKGNKAQELTIQLLCMDRKEGCGKTPNHPDPKKRCNCGAHQFTGERLEEKMKELGSKVGLVADAWVPPQPVEKHARCHEKTYVGVGYVEYWVGMGSVRVYYDIYVLYGPCAFLGGGGGGGGGDPMGMNKPGKNGLSVAFLKGSTDWEQGTIPVFPKGPIPVVPTNPSVDPKYMSEAAGRVAALRRPFDLAPLPRAWGATLAIPTYIFAYDRQRLARSAEEYVENSKKTGAAWWTSDHSKGIFEKDWSGGSRDNVYDWPVILPNGRDGGGR